MNLPDPDNFKCPACGKSKLDYFQENLNNKNVIISMKCSTCNGCPEKLPEARTTAG